MDYILLYCYSYS